jgi:hypothetical protein
MLVNSFTYHVFVTLRPQLTFWRVLHVVRRPARGDGSHMNLKEGLVRYLPKADVRCASVTPHAVRHLTWG